MGLDQVRQRSGLEISDGHEKRTVGPEIPAVVRDHIVASQQPDIAQASSRISTQRVRAVDETPEDQVGMTGRIFPIVLQLGQNPLLGPFDGTVGEDGLANQVGQQLARQGKVLDADPQRAARRADLHRPAHVLDRGGQLGCRAVPGPFLQQPAGQVRDSRPILAEEAGIDIQLQGDDSRLGPPLVDDAQSILQPQPPGPVIDQPRDAAGNLDRGQAGNQVRRRWCGSGSGCRWPFGSLGPSFKHPCRDLALPRGQGH